MTENIEAQSNISKRLLDELGASHNAQLPWGTTDESHAARALARRKRALKDLRKSRTKQKRATAEAIKAKVARQRGKPRKRSWLEERQIAIFILHRRLEKRPGKNAVTDACDKFNVSRATVFRIQARHKEGAMFMALMLWKSRGKVFRKAVKTRKRIRLPDFSDWGPDRY